MSRVHRCRAGAMRAGYAVALSAACLIGSVASASSSPVQPDPGQDERVERLRPGINEVMGIDPLDVIHMPMRIVPGSPVLMDLPIEDNVHTLLMLPHSIRADGYQVIVQLEDGSYAFEEPGPVRTLRGQVMDVPGAMVAGSALDDGLHMVIHMHGDRYWLQPVDDDVPGARPGDYLLYRSGDVHPSDVTCGGPNADVMEIDAVVPPPIGGGVAGGGACIAELACDADTEYYNDYGSVAAVEAQINAVFNSVNLQYESQVGITHAITAIVVRTGTDPYTSTDAQSRLCQFITEWTNNQGAIQRDVAHLFTGAELNGSTIGIASDIGNTGICQNSGACVGGTYGTQGSYCLSQSDFNGNYSCATDLSAHEMGHLWGAFHCSCSGNTMNSSITCANTFSAGTISSITAYRDTRTCLTGNCPGPPPGPSNDNCADAEPFGSDGTLSYSTVGANTDGPSNPSNTCNDFGQNQTWNDIWYTYDASCTGTLTVSTCNNIHGQGNPSYDTDLVVYGPYASIGAINCGTLSSNLAACNDDDPNNSCGTSAPYSSTIELNVAQGDVYLIRVGGWSSADSGSGTLYVDCNGTSASGACCFTDGSCTDGTAGDCAAAGGTYQGDGTNCGSANCPQPSGACCFGDGSCSIETAGDCSSSGGTYQGDGTNCGSANCPQPTGACCFGDGSCAVETAGDCSSAGGTYQGDGTDCSPNPCPQPTGACCFGDGSCAELTSANCTSGGGSYQGDGVSCASANCPQPTGACCFGDGSCSVDTAGDCTSSGGTYQGDGTNCSPNPCQQPDPTGACCFGDGTCSVETANDCTVAGGTYQGNGSSCSPNPCPLPTGACCHGDGSCTIEIVDDCNAAGGSYQGDGTDCGSANCPQPSGACCYGDGSCSNETASDCSAAGGSYQGDGTDCGSANCPQPTGACCTGSVCSVGTAFDCTSMGGVYQGDGTDCAGVNCSPTGGLLEAGTVAVGGTPVTVALQGTYVNPVVVCGVQYDNNSTPVVARVDKVLADSFTVRLQNPSNGSVAVDTVHYIVVEEGVHVIDGVKIEAVRYTSTTTSENNNWNNADTRSYGQSYSNPVVLGQVMTENDTDWSVFWCRASGNRNQPPSSSSLLTGKTVCEDTDVTRANEDIGYIVIEAGSGTIGGVAFEAALGNDSVRGIGNSPAYAYSFGTAFSSAPSVLVTTQAAMDGNNGGWSYVYGGTGATATQLFLAVDEDQIRDSERRHTSEQVGYIVFESSVFVP